MHYAVFELYSKYGHQGELADLKSRFLEEYVQLLVDTDIAPITDKLHMPVQTDTLKNLEIAYKTLISYKHYKKCY